MKLYDEVYHQWVLIWINNLSTSRRVYVLTVINKGLINRTSMTYATFTVLTERKAKMIQSRMFKNNMICLDFISTVSQRLNITS